MAAFPNRRLLSDEEDTAADQRDQAGRGEGAVEHKPRVQTLLPHEVAEQRG